MLSNLKSIRQLTTSSGFTLVEVLIVIGILSVLTGAYLFIDLNSYRGDAFRAEADS